MALSVCRTVIDDFARELLKHGTAAFPIACYHDDLQTEPVPWHWHEELEVLVVSEGTILATAAGEKYRLEKGEGLFINAGVLHGDWPLNAGPCRLHSMVFHPRLVGGSPDSVFWQKYLQPLLTTSSGIRKPRKCASRYFAVCFTRRMPSPSDFSSAKISGCSAWDTARSKFL